MNTIYKVLGILALLVMFCFNAYSDEVQLADSAYNKGEYAEAVEIYNDVINKKGVSSQLYFNIGNAYAKAGDYGLSMVNYKRALLLDPGNKSARENIKYLESKVLESNQSELRGKKFSLEPEETPFLTGLKYFVIRDHLSDTWFAWSVVCFCLFIACLAIYLFLKNVNLRKIGFFGGFISLILSVIFIIFSFGAASYKSDEAVIITPKVRLMSDPSETSKESPINLTRGTVLKVIDQYPSEEETTWYKVRLNSDFVGWLPKDDIVLVQS